MSGPNTWSAAVQDAVGLGPYRLNVTVPVGTVLGALIPLLTTVAVSVTIVPVGPPELADVVVFVPVGGGGGGGAAIATDSPGAPQRLLDAENPDPAAGV